jgi:hypothetical protein
MINFLSNEDTQELAPGFFIKTIYATPLYKICQVTAKKMSTIKTKGPPSGRPEGGGRSDTREETPSGGPEGGGA